MDITGVDFVGIARDAIITKLTPIAECYSYHNVADLRLNRFTVAVESASPEYLGGQDQTWVMVFSVRAHTAYVGGTYNEENTLALLISATNALMVSRNLGNGCKITIQAGHPGISDLKTNQEFKESATLGGEFKCEVNLSVSYPQV